MDVLFSTRFDVAVPTLPSMTTVVPFDAKQRNHEAVPVASADVSEPIALNVIKPFDVAGAAVSGLSLPGLG